MRSFRWVLVLAALVPALVAVGGVQARTDGAAAKAPIKIGISLPLTGNFSEPGTAAKRGYEVWADLLNKRGGLLGRKVQLIIKDDQSDQNTIVNDYNRLITEDKVDLLLGTFSSLLNLPASAVAEKFHMGYVEPAGGSPAMFSRGFKYLFFAQQATAPHQADLFSNWARRLPKSKRPKTAAYPTQDDPFTKPVIAGIQDKLESAGIKTVYSKVYAPDTTDFDTIAAGVKASGADLVAEGAVFDDAVGVDALREGDRRQEHGGHLLCRQLEPRGEREELSEEPGVPEGVQEALPGEAARRGRRRRVRRRPGARNGAPQGRQDRPGQDQGLPARPCRQDDSRPVELGFARRAAAGVPARAVARRCLCARRVGPDARVRCDERDQRRARRAADPRCIPDVLRMDAYG